MPDQLFDQFRFETTPPPVEEVRRRGDRRRRRTAAAMAVGAAAAVIAVVAPVALLSSGSDRGAPPPAHTGSVTPTAAAEGWVTTIPGSFPLQQGMATQPAPSLNTIVDPQAPVTLHTELPIDIGGCDAPLWEYADTRQTMLAQWTDGVEAMQVRSLSLYDNATTAQTALDAIRQGLGGCPGGPLSPVVVPLDGAVSLPGSAVAWVQPNGTGGAPDGTGTAYVVVQVDNALIIDRANLGGAADAAARRHTVRNLTSRLSGVAHAAATTFPAPAGAAVVGAFGPTGFGALTLGMTPDAALATGEVTGSAAAGYRLADGSPVCFQPGNVLTAITAPAGAKTPEGIGEGSTTAQVRAAFHLGPHARDAGWSVPAGPGASYHFFVVLGKGLTELTLEGPRQSCWG